MMDGFSDFWEWVMGHAIGKLFLLALFVAPVVALLAFLGIRLRKKSNTSKSETGASTP